jgi:hypothetical protein
LKAENDNFSSLADKEYVNDRTYLNKIERNHLMAEKNDKIKFL